MGDNRVNITRITRRQRQENDDKRGKALKKDKPTQRNDKKKILIVTERRADFSRFKPILDLIKKEPLPFLYICSHILK
jgi:hypothetical protein